MKDVTVQECQLPVQDGGCGGLRYCAEHITWSEDLHLWIDDKCLRKVYGLKRARAAQAKEDVA